MNLSRKQRAQVVELLRCAADACVTLEPDDMFTRPSLVARRHLGSCRFVWNMAGKATRALNDGCDRADSRDHYIACCLEAAQRVEDGVWPPKESDFPRAIVHRIGGKP